ncbi:MAG: hypothetical protein RLZZ52_1286, partial [Actinomycetota bacterium]
MFAPGHTLSRQNRDMNSSFHRPALFAGHEFSAFQGGDDPAEVSAIAHDTARALLSRVRDESQPDIVQKVVSFADENGIDTLAELWSRSSAHSLPGALWRMYLIRDLIRAQAPQISVLFGQGLSMLSTADVVVAGAPTPAGPEEMVSLADTILHGA